MHWHYHIRLLETNLSVCDGSAIFLPNLMRFSKILTYVFCELWIRIERSVGIDLKELGEGVSCRIVWNFTKRLKFKADFHSKMNVCRHKLGVQPPPPDNSNPDWTTQCDNPAENCHVNCLVHKLRFGSLFVAYIRCAESMIICSCSVVKTFPV